MRVISDLFGKKIQKNSLSHFKQNMSEVLANLCILSRVIFIFYAYGLGGKKFYFLKRKIHEFT